METRILSDSQARGQVKTLLSMDEKSRVEYINKISLQTTKLLMRTIENILHISELCISSSKAVSDTESNRTGHLQTISTSVEGGTYTLDNLSTITFSDRYEANSHESMLIESNKMVGILSELQQREFILEQYNQARLALASTAHASTDNPDIVAVPKQDYLIAMQAASSHEQAVKDQMNLQKQLSEMVSIRQQEMKNHQESLQAQLNKLTKEKKEGEAQLQKKLNTLAADYDKTMTEQNKYLDAIILQQKSEIDKYKNEIKSLETLLQKEQMPLVNRIRHEDLVSLVDSYKSSLSFYQREETTFSNLLALTKNKQASYTLEEVQSRIVDTKYKEIFNNPFSIAGHDLTKNEKIIKKLANQFRNPQPAITSSLRNK